MSRSILTQALQISISEGKDLVIYQVDSTSFDVKLSDGTVERKEYEFVFAVDGGYSSVRKHFMTQQDYAYTQYYNEYAYLQINISSTEETNTFNMPRDDAMHVWPRDKML